VKAMNERELEELEQKMKYLEKELYVVKRELIRAKEESVERPSQKVAVSTTKQVEQEVEKQAENQPQPEDKGIDFSVEWWLPKVFLFVLLIGSIWGFMAASQNGWLTPGFRVVIGAVVSILMYAGGERFIKDQRKLGITLLSGSIVLSVITLFSANILYGFINGIVTNILLVLLIAAGIWLSHHHKSQLILCLIGVGAYLFPFIFAGEARNEWLFYGYQLIIFFLLTTFSFLKGYRFGWNISYYLLYFTMLFFAVFGMGEITIKTIFPFAIQHVYLLSIIILDKGKRLNAELIPAFVSGTFILMGLMQIVYRDMPLWYYALLGIIYIAVSFFQRMEKKSTKDVLLLLGSIHLLLLVLEYVEYDWSFLLLGIQAVVLLMLAYQRKSYINLAASFVLIFISFLGTVLQPIGHYFGEIVPAFVLYFGYVYTLKMNNKKFFTMSSAMLKTFSTGLVFIFLLRSTSELVNDWLYSDRMTAFTVAFAVFSIFYLIFGESKKDVFYRWVGISFLGITLVKFFLMDLVFLDFAIRAMILIPIGVIGLVLSRVLYKKKQ
jgi:uncharacterized membrane protein